MHFCVCEKLKNKIRKCDVSYRKQANNKKVFPVSRNPSHLTMNKWQTISFSEQTHDLYINFVQCMN